MTTNRVRQGRRGEARLPAVVAVLAAIALYALLPETLLVFPRLLIPALGVLLLIALTVVNPRRLTRETKVSRIASLALVALSDWPTPSRSSCCCARCWPARCRTAGRC